MKKPTPSPGHASLRRWQPDHRPGDLPVWLRKHIRATIIAKSKARWEACPHPWGYLPNDLFDHWGSIPAPAGGKLRWVYAMPYGETEAEARAFAKRYGVRLVDINCPGPWHPKTTCYVFAPPLP